MEIAVIKNCLGAVCGAIERDRWAEYCEYIDAGDTVAIYIGENKIEELNGADFVRLYK